MWNLIDNEEATILRLIIIIEYFENETNFANFLTQISKFNVSSNQIELIIDIKLKGIPYEQTTNNSYSFEAYLQFDSFIYVLLENSIGMSNPSEKLSIEKTVNNMILDETKIG